MATEKKQLFQIQYEDAQILVCVKPAGVASETKKAGQQDMVSLLRNYRSLKGEEPYIGLVHRLDQPVEGLLVFGKNPKSTSELCRQIANGSFSKVYLAVTEGTMPSQEGKLQNYLKKDGRSNTSAVTSKTDPQAKKAELFYQVLQVLQPDTNNQPIQNLVKINLLTGRHHQIRVQMAYLGTPLVGDTKYGSVDTAYTKYKNDRKNSDLGLCACELEFVHPVTGKVMKFTINPSGKVFQIFLASS